jgi:hypothetical protein
MKKIIFFTTLLFMFYACSHERNTPLSEEEQQRILNEKVEHAYQQIKTTADAILLSDAPIDGFETMVTEYEKMEEVKVVEVREDGLFVKMGNDKVVGWYIPPFGKEENLNRSLKNLPQIRTVSQNSAAYNLNACIINQLYNDEREFALGCSLIVDTLGEYFNNPNIVNGNASNLIFYQGQLSEYDAIFIISHGTIISNKHYIATGQEVGSGNVFLPVTVARITLSEDRNGTIQPIEYYWISEDFIRENYEPHSFNNTLVYSVTCRGMQNNSSLAEAFTEKGASVFIGWNETNCIGHTTGLNLFRELLNGKTLSAAIESLNTNQITEIHIGNHNPATLTFYPASAGSYRLIETTQNLTGGLVAYYPFNGNANDESGNGNHGTVNGNVTLTTGRQNDMNGSYEFSGEVFNYISIPDNPSLNISSFTISAWINIPNDGGGYIVNKGRDILNGSYRLNTSDIGATTLYDGVNGAQFFDNIPYNQWVMLTGTVNGDIAKSYINGQLVVTETLSSVFSCNSPNEPLTIGNHYYNGVPDFYAYPFKGKIDDIRIYSQALSDNEIQALYNEGSN